MTRLLDTNVCIEYPNNPASRIREKLGTLDPREICVCSMVVAELLFGARRTAKPERAIAVVREFLASFVSFPFDDRAAEEHGRLRAYLAQEGAPIGPHDIVIASIAMANKIAVITHNTREFCRIPELVVEDWQQ